MANQSDVPFEPNADRPAELDELNFEDDESSFIDVTPDVEVIEGKAENDEDNNPVMPGDEPTDDDLSPETLIKEDGARSPHEIGGERPTDQDLTIVDEDEIGAGYGLDEAELAKATPLDGKQWDEDAEKEN